MNKNKLYIREYQINTSSLTSSEKKVLDKLVQAAKLVAPIYSQQINDDYPGANYYPHDAAKEEIEIAALENPAILDPFTVVERENGKLVPIPFHVKYREQLSSVSKLLKEAAELSENKDFAKRLVMQANVLLDGDYEAADIYWLTMKPSKLLLIIAPQERYEDHLFYIKNCYTAIVGIIDENRTEEAVKIKDMVISPKRQLKFPADRVEFLDKMQIRVDKIAVTAGLDARCMFTAADFPNDPKLAEKYGVQLVILSSPLDYRFEMEFYPIFKRVFAPEFQSRYSTKLLTEASVNYVLLHEIGHALLRYRDAEGRLKEALPIIEEIAAYILGIKNFGALLLKDAITQKQLEALFCIFIVRCFSWWQLFQNSRAVEGFAKGHAIALNYFFENGAIAESNGISWPNFTKMYMGFDNLSDALERLLAIGQYQGVKFFVEKFANFDVFEKFRPRLFGLVSEG